MIWSVAVSFTSGSAVDSRCASLRASHSSRQAARFLLSIRGQELARDVQIAEVRRGFGGVTLAYNARKRQEVDAVLAEAVAAGAKLLRPAQDAFWGGYSGYFADPDGFVWEAAWNPFFEIAQDGSIRLPA